MSYFLKCVSVIKILRRTPLLWSVIIFVSWLTFLPRSGRLKIQNLNSLISLVNIIKVAVKSCLKWQTTNQVFDTFVQSKQKCSRMAKRAGFRAGFRRTLKITLLYQFHAQKALFKVPKICNINFWIENATLPPALWNFSKNSSNLVARSSP